MKFTEILENLKKGERVTREKWEKPGCTIDFIVYDQDKGKFLLFYNGNCHSFVFNDEDIVAEDWKLYEGKPTRTWKPEFGEKYYYMTTNGNVGQDTFNTSFDKYRLSFRNVFKTAEEARKMVEKIKIINQLQELSNIKFSENKGKYFIYYNFRENRVLCTETNYTKIIPFEVCFKTREDCQKAIETIGEDNLKKYYFDVED